MVSRYTTVSFLCWVLTSLLPLASAQYGTPNSSNSHGGSSPPSSSSTATGGSNDYPQTASFKRSARILIIHAVLGTLAWAFFAPLGAIFLRLNIPGVSLLKFHIITQLFVYAMTIATTGLGIWLAIGASKYGNKWMDSHVIIGLVIFSVGTIQPWLGWIHHLIFKKRLIKHKKGVATRRPGRTTITRFHIWIGRTLILLGVINGGLGLRLAAGTPYQTASTTRKAEIAYGVVAALMFLLFAGVSTLFEYRRAARIRSRRVGQEMPPQSRRQSVMVHSRSNSRSMPFSPMSSEDSVAYDEKGSEAGR
jgi:hypothetical protein